MRRKFQFLKARNYGNESVNRLAVIEDQFSEMGEAERAATLGWLASKYGPTPDPRSRIERR